MCGRTTLFAPRIDIERRFDARFAYEYRPRYNIAPGGPGLPAIRDENRGAIERLHWGIVPGWVDDREDWHGPINARAETVADGPTFRSAFEQRRCLVLADGFYEWTGPSGKRQPHRVVVDGGSCFAMAGLWETWSGDGDEVTSVAVVTTEANEVVGELHDRMPVIIAPDEEAAWLERDDADELRSLLDAYPAERTEAYEVSSAVNSPANDSPALVEPLGGSQAGLEEFG